MYQFSYAEVQQDDVADSKDRERQVLDKSILMLEQASEKGAGSRESIEALFFVNRVWVRFIEDLGSPENELDQELRANLISIGIWILREAEKIRAGESDNYEGIIDISSIIRDGLK
ncbi:flagellar biosynthesis regulator FlaF [Hoeflea prorocentri]|uniref:Flagellar biosynthesis regulator FlaF n=1 Tax=Hoeflea prorocentri TaxID=1922333 RepID=A0A9X3ZHZ8_9HYPH|nr:flagellar biosynthesis regulator FlaF [Hoeflea prorocentri]MCY6382377.1 flagellar biosynthesis regulator FlaF [Hoeflea prorocentri]MDA5400177.1 flagellar biosynthesis regulator FlaF [Hoeflea prorocentri]